MGGPDDSEEGGPDDSEEGVEAGVVVVLCLALAVPLQLRQQLRTYINLMQVTLPSPSSSHSSCQTADKINIAATQNKPQA